MLSYDKQLKALSQHLRKNMTDAENILSFSDRDVFENIGGVMEEIWGCL